MKIQTKISIVMIVTSLIPLIVLGFLYFHDISRIQEEIAGHSMMMDHILDNKTMQHTESLIEELFLRQANTVSENIVHFLNKREKDLLFIESEYYEDTTKFKKDLIEFQILQTSQIWYNINTDLNPIEKKENIPIYSEIVVTDTTGKEIIKIKDGKSSSNLKDISILENTEFKQEDYWEKTKDLPEGEIYVSRINTWYISQAEARKSLPPDQIGNKKWNNLSGRDTMKSGNLRFATPIYHNNKFQGIAVLTVDYRHMQELTKHADPASTVQVVSTPYEGNYILFADDEGNTIVHPKPNNIRGYLPDGSLQHTNTKDTPGGIFNLKDYDKTASYNKIYKSTVIDKEILITSATDLKNRTKMTVSIPVVYNKGEYKDKGVFGLLMLSVNIDKYFESTQESKEELLTGMTILGEELTHRTSRSITGILFFIAALFLLSISLGMIVSRKISDPIIQLKETAEQIGQGKKINLPEFNSEDEIQELGSAIKQMAQNLEVYQQKLLDIEKERAKELEQEVGTKTSQLNLQLKEAENAKKATLNIMEDMNDLNAQLQTANEELKELDKAKSNFLNVASHELKTPLTAMLAHIGILDLLGKNLSATELKSLNAIKRNSHNLKTLINNILEIARMEAGKFELSVGEVDISELIQGVVKDIKILSDKKGVEIKTQVSKIPTIQADEMRIREIFTNLLGNAIKFTEKGHILIEAHKEGNLIRAKVKDTGVGIPEEKQRHLFEKFYQADNSATRKYDGTGLGLSISKQLVEMHGGKITCKSVKGKGTTFSFTLPI